MAHHTTSRPHFAPKSPLKRFSFLSLTPTPSSDRTFARLLDSDSEKEQPRTPTHNKSHRRSPSLQNFNKKLFTATITPKNRFALPFTMPSWSTSSKSSLSSSTSSHYAQPSSPGYSKPKTTRRRYMPVPFFTAVAEYQLLNGGSDKSAIRAILRERGLDMTVEQAIAYFDNEDVNGVIHNPPFSHPDMDEYAQLVPRRLSSDGDTSSDDNSHSSSRFMSSIRRRGPPAPLQVPPRSPYGFEDSFNPSPCSPSNASFVSSAASTTIYSPSFVSGKSSKSGSSMVKGMFHKLSGRK